MSFEITSLHNELRGKFSPINIKCHFYFLSTNFSPLKKAKKHEKLPI